MDGRQGEIGSVDNHSSSAERGTPCTWCGSVPRCQQVGKGPEAPGHESKIAQMRARRLRPREICYVFTTYDFFKKRAAVFHCLHLCHPVVIRKVHIRPARESK
jgi:hypothetical protein